MKISNNMTLNFNMRNSLETSTKEIASFAEKTMASAALLLKAFSTDIPKNVFFTTEVCLK